MNNQLKNQTNQLLEIFKKEQFIRSLKIISGKLIELQLIRKFIKRSRFLLCVIDIFSKYAWVAPLNDEKGVSIIDAFQKILDKSRHKPNKIWVDKGSKFYNNSF